MIRYLEQVCLFLIIVSALQNPCKADELPTPSTVRGTTWAKTIDLRGVQDFKPAWTERHPHYTRAGKIVIRSIEVGGSIAQIIIMFVGG